MRRTIDVTWTQHYTPETKQESKQWAAKGELAMKKAIPITGKVMATVFSNAKGILLIDYLEKGITINRKYNANRLEQFHQKNS